MVKSEKDAIGAVLSQIPDFFLLQNMKKLTSLGEDGEVTQGNVTSRAGKARELIMQHQNDIPQIKIQKLDKITRIVSLNSEWSPFKLKKAISADKVMALSGDSFPVKEFANKSKASVSGVFHAHEVNLNTVILAAEFKSKSISQRKLLRFLFLTESNILLAEVADQEEEFMKSVIFAKLNLNEADVELKKINARMIRRVAKKFTPIRLSFMVSIETAGVEGLSYITLEGDNVIRGMETLKSRQEFDLDPSNLGPWVAVETDTVDISVKKPIRIKKATTELYETLTYAMM